jgi:hypothetical protein
MNTPSKRQVITLDKKKAIIDAATKNKNKTALAKQFKLPESTIRRILKDEEAILKATEEGSIAKRARLTKGKHEEMEEALVLWIKQVRSQNLPVSGEIVKVSFYSCFSIVAFIRIFHPSIHFRKKQKKLLLCCSFYALL